MAKLIKEVQCDKCGSKDKKMLESNATVFRCRFCSNMVKVQPVAKAKSAAKAMSSHTDQIEAVKKAQMAPVKKEDRGTDVDGDGKVDAKDLEIAKKFKPLEADVNKDGKIDEKDFKMIDEEIKRNKKKKKR